MRNADSRLPIERFANAYTFVTGLFVAAVVLAIAVAMILMGNTLARAIGLGLVVLAAAVVRMVRRRNPARRRASPDSAHQRRV